MATRSKLSRIDKRKRLDALFDRGSYVRFAADNGVPVIDPPEDAEGVMAIWVSPPSPLQREMAVREAQGARARALIDGRRTEGSPDWLSVRGFIASLNTPDLIDYLVELDDTDFLAQARRDVLVRKEWDDFPALQDAMRQYDESDDKESEEWASLLQRDIDFGQQVTEQHDQLRADAKDGYLHMPRHSLEEKAIDKRIEQAGSGAFMSTYEQWMLFYSLRDDEDHTALYFDDINDVKSLPAEVQLALAEKLASFITDLGEAKN